MTFGTAISFVVGLLGLVACWLSLGQQARLARWPAVSQAAFLSWPALRNLLHVEWVLAVLVIIPLVVKPRPHVELGRFCLSVMAGMLLAGAVAAA